MQNPNHPIREAALKLGYTDVKPATGHPFDVWRKRLSSIPLGEHLSFEHDPVKITGWGLDEITVWAAVAPTPPRLDWPKGCGEIGAYYLEAKNQNERQAAWENAVTDMGYEIKRGVTLPERAMAIRAGLGVYGLNGLLISPEYGSYVSITVLLVRDKPPSEAHGPEHDMSPGCGNCGICMENCPTGAITEKGMDATMHICLRHYMSWADDMTEAEYIKMGRRIQGCDTCQMVCPKNSHVKKIPTPGDLHDCMKLENILAGPDFDSITKYIPRNWINETRFKSQAILAAANTDRKDLLPLIEALVGSEDSATDKMAQWAVKRLKD
jgi:epoxyqueuosine reductase QueG